MLILLDVLKQLVNEYDHALINLILNTKYSMTLEKRNHVKKNVRKLYISGVISTDPFMIMDSQRKFYVN